MATSAKNVKMVEFEGQQLEPRLGLRPLARALGIAHTTLLAHERNGDVSRGPDKKFDTAQVIKYRSGIPQDHKARGAKAKKIAAGEAEPETSTEERHDINLSKAKKEHWLAERARIQTEKAAGKLLEREVVEATLEAIGSEIVTGMMNLKPKLRPYMSDAGKDVLDRSIDATLRDIASKLKAAAEADHGDD